MRPKTEWLSLEKLQRQHPEVKDPHKLRAMNLFGISEVEVTEAQRNSGVVVNTSEVYGVSLAVAVAMLSKDKVKDLNAWLPKEFIQTIGGRNALHQ